MRLRVHLVDPAPEPVDSIEQVYTAGLAALSKDEALAALEHFRSVVAQDPDGTYSTARLLALLLSAEVGDVASLRALLDSCLTNAQPDAFAQRAIEKSGLDFYSRTDSEDADIIVRECIDQSAITAQVALAGCFLALGRPADAVNALVDGVTAWEARHTAWKIQVGRIADEVEAGKRLPSGLAIRESLERALTDNWPEAVHGLRDAGGGHSDALTCVSDLCSLRDSRGELAAVEYGIEAACDIGGRATDGSGSHLADECRVRCAPIGDDKPSVRCLVDEDDDPVAVGVLKRGEDS